MGGQHLFIACVAVFNVSAHGFYLKPVGVNASDVLHFFSNTTTMRFGAKTLDGAFDRAFKSFEKSFDFEAYSHFQDLFQQGMQRYASYTSYPDRPHCDKGPFSGASIPRSSSVTGMSAFPGGTVGQVFGFDFGRSMFKLSKEVQGPPAAGLIAPMSLASQSLAIGAGLMQSMMSAIIHVVPPLVPPPAWNNQPLPCVPMVTGHNCFGAVLYPITMADFVIADVTDSMLDGVIAGFPNTYASRVGKTNDEMYKTCFSSYMSMHCSSIFPRCTTPQSRDEPIPVGGRVPMCLHLCVIPLVTCPGLWIEDLIGTCSMVSVPPLCTQAFYWNLYRLPPQYVSFDEANPYPRECPRTDWNVSGLDASEDSALYDQNKLPTSPILAEAITVGRVPNAN